MSTATVNAEVHVAGPVEPVDGHAEQRCLRCDELLAYRHAAESYWKLGTRVGVRFQKGRTRLYVVENAELREDEQECSAQYATV